MIKRVILENFKSIKKQVFEFSDFDLIVGVNNSGKSTILQALAIWQFAVDTFRSYKKTGQSGVQLILPNFTALPVPEFNLLWHERTDRAYKEEDGKKKQEFILIVIDVVWINSKGEEESLPIELRYQSSQTLYAKPKKAWEHFHEAIKDSAFPTIAYVPPFSGLETTEKRLDEGPIRQQIGKGQPGSILRNLLLLVSNSEPKAAKGEPQVGPWTELTSLIELWFGVKLNRPKYETGKDVEIKVEYTKDKRNYDIIAGGSGFHQILTLLAFIKGYKPTTILLDEPDAHLHVRLQKDALQAFKRFSDDGKVQFLIATHAETFMRGVDMTEILSLLERGVSRRVQALPEVIGAMSEVANDEIVRLESQPLILYLEGDTDERILRAWAQTLGYGKIFSQFLVKPMGGGSKVRMEDLADKHFRALRQILPNVKRHMLFDRDLADESLRPSPDNITISVWGRRNIESYLIVLDAWERQVANRLEPLLAVPARNIIQTKFVSENLTLPPGADWKTLSINVFKTVDGKEILFSGKDSLFQQLRNSPDGLVFPREDIATAMTTDEIHVDVDEFFRKLRAVHDLAAPHPSQT